MHRRAFSISAALTAAAIGAGTAASAQDYDGYYRGHRTYRHYEGCHALVRSTGVGYPFEGISRNSAIKAWRRESEAVYGRDFNWDEARDRDMFCEPYKLVIRCTASARPCE